MATGTLPGWLPLQNRIMEGLNKLGLTIGPVRVLTVPGRTSGEPRTTPVTPIPVDGGLYVIAALPNADWARNVRAAGRGTVTAGRRSHDVTITEVADPVTRERVLRAFPVQARGGVPFFVRLGLVTSADPDQFAAVADRVAVFEISG
jgi:deazaflavin-dependent oxidoreductase (nitroreductase family)